MATERRGVRYGIRRCERSIRNQQHFRTTSLAFVISLSIMGVQTRRKIDFFLSGNCDSTRKGKSMFSRFSLSFLVFSGLCWQAVTPSNADVVVANNGGTTVSAFGGWFGQSVTTPTGGPWGNIKFSFVNLVNGADVPVASGGLYVLSQNYAGTPNALSASTPGFLGFTNVISGGQWQFSGLTLNPNTPYFFYMDSPTNSTIKFSLGNPYAGGLGYNAVGATTNYQTIGTNFDLNFSLQGDSAAVPEGSSVAFMSVVSLVSAAAVWIRKRRSA